MKFNNTNSPKFQLIKILKDNNIKEFYAQFTVDNYIFMSHPDVSEEEIRSLVLNQLGRALIDEFLAESWKNRVIKQENTINGLQFRTSMFFFNIDQLLSLMEEAYVAGMKQATNWNCQNDLNPLPSNLPVKLKDDNNA